MLLGSHLSIAGGVQNAIVAAGKYGFKTCAIFVRNQRQWAAPPLKDEDVKAFRKARRELAVAPVVAHGSYLINLGDRGPQELSLTAAADEMDRCQRLGVEYYVLHPGGAEDEEAGIARIAEGINELLAGQDKSRVKLLLETTAGQGTSIAYKFEQIAGMLEGVEQPRRVGVCMDTCHVFAAGYDIRTPEAYTETMAQFDRVIGLRRVMAIHLNDSKTALGSRVDRHEHIGKGQIGVRGIANFVNDPALAKVPMILETPKGDDASGRDYDKLNASAVRRLVRRG